MIALLKDGEEIECQDFTHEDNGIILGNEHGDIIGYIPHRELVYIYPEEE